MCVKMEVNVHANGQRNRIYRPYISQEESSSNFGIYDPNGQGPNYGLYDSQNPGCGKWMDHVDQYAQIGGRAHNPTSLYQRRR
jgi:hypothetical protein